MKRKNTIFVSAIIVSTLLTGCMSTPLFTDEQATVRATNPNYSATLSYITQNENELYSTHDQVVLNLDEGLLRHFTGEYEASTKNLSEAEKLIENYFSKSITQAVGSFIVNDKEIDYPGEDYEDIYTNLFMSLNYYHQNKLDDAAVEINRFINKTQALSARHEEELVKARQAANDTDKTSVNIQFHNSALGRYLSLLYHRAQGNMDEAQYDARMLSDAFLTQNSVYPFAEPSCLKEELSVPADKGRLNVLAFSGISPMKIEQRTSFTDAYVLAIPLMQVRPSPVGKVNVVAVEKESAQTYSMTLETIENLNAIATETFAIRSKIIYDKAIARCLVKGTTTVASAAIGDQLADSSDQTLSNIGSMLQLFSAVNNISNQLTEQADLRIGHYFPGRADIAGLTLPQGTYNVTVTFYAAGSASILSERVFADVVVASGKLSLVEADCLGI